MKHEIIQVVFYIDSGNPTSPMRLFNPKLKYINEIDVLKIALKPNELSWHWALHEVEANMVCYFCLFVCLYLFVLCLFMIFRLNLGLISKILGNRFWIILKDKLSLRSFKKKARYLLLFLFK